MQNLYAQLEYQEYTDGILRGCKVQVRGKALVIRPGMVKYHGVVHLMGEERMVPYHATGELQALKIRLVEKWFEDAVCYDMELVLDEDLNRKENEIEICRFCLRPGEVLRTAYVDFSDMQARYGTVDLTEATWSGIDANPLPPAVTRYYAKNILRESSSSPQDITFAWLCLNAPVTVMRCVVEDYIGRAFLIRDTTQMSNSELYCAMVKNLSEVRKGRAVDWRN